MKNISVCIKYAAIVFFIRNTGLFSCFEKIKSFTSERSIEIQDEQITRMAILKEVEPIIRRADSLHNTIGYSISTYFEDLFVLKTIPLGYADKQFSEFVCSQQINHLWQTSFESNRRHPEFDLQLESARSLFESKWELFQLEHPEVNPVPEDYVSFSGLMSGIWGLLVWLFLYYVKSIGAALLMYIYWDKKGIRKIRKKTIIMDTLCYPLVFIRMIVSDVLSSYIEVEIISRLGHRRVITVEEKERFIQLLKLNPKFFFKVLRSSYGIRRVSLVTATIWIVLSSCAQFPLPRESDTSSTQEISLSFSVELNHIVSTSFDYGDTFDLFCESRNLGDYVLKHVWIVWVTIGKTIRIIFQIDVVPRDMMFKLVNNFYIISKQNIQHEKNSNLFYSLYF